MVMVREMTMEEWQVLRDIRLEALQDAPDAFYSTYEREAVRGEADWRCTISQSGTFLAYTPEADQADPAGLVSGFQEIPEMVELMSMWVRPRLRGVGVGEALVAAVVGWARARNATSVHLWVIETNKYARLLYKRCGFAPTGERQPLPSNRNAVEVGMACSL